MRILHIALHAFTAIHAMQMSPDLPPAEHQPDPMVVACEPYEEAWIRNAAADLEHVTNLGLQASHEQSQTLFGRGLLSKYFGENSRDVRRHVHGILSAVHAQAYYVRQIHARPVAFPLITIMCVDLEQKCTTSRAGYVTEGDTIVIIVSARFIEVDRPC